MSTNNSNTDLATLTDDYNDAAEVVAERFNCSKVEIDDAGHIWVEGPMAGHWVTVQEAIAARLCIEEDPSIDLDDPPSSWAGHDDGYIVVGRTAYSIKYGLDEAEQALADAGLDEAEVWYGDGPNAVTGSFRVFAR